MSHLKAMVANVLRGMSDDGLWAVAQYLPEDFDMAAYGATSTRDKAALNKVASRKVRRMSPKKSAEVIESSLLSALTAGPRKGMLVSELRDKVRCGNVQIRLALNSLASKGFLLLDLNEHGLPKKGRLVRLQAPPAVITIDGSANAAAAAKRAG